MQTENISIKGVVSVCLYDGASHVTKHEETFNNLVTTAGKNFIIRKIIDDTERVKSIGIGSGNTSATVDDIQLEAELANVDLAFEFIDTQNTNIIHFVTTFEENIGTGTVREVGLFSDSDPQKLLCRTVVTTPFEKASTDYLVVTWKIQIG